MNRIKTLSSYLLIVFNVLLLVLPLVLLCEWMLMDWGPIKWLVKNGIIFHSLPSASDGVIDIATVKWNFISKSIGLLSGIVELLPVILSIFVLKTIFQNYKKGEIFTLDNAHSYRYLGWLFFLYGLIAQPLSGMFMSIACTIFNEPGHRIISIGFGTPNIEAVLCGLLVLVISSVMVEGHKMQEEHKFVI